VVMALKSPRAVALLGFLLVHTARTVNAYRTPRRISSRQMPTRSGGRPS
jgi:hypothetical protein